MQQIIDSSTSSSATLSPTVSASVDCALSSAAFDDDVDDQFLKEMQAHNQAIISKNTVRPIDVEDRQWAAEAIIGERAYNGHI